MEPIISALALAAPALVAEVTRLSDPARDYSIGWGTLALVNAGIAEGKKRSGLNWFLLSLFLGPLGTLILVATMTRLPSPPPPAFGATPPP